MYYAFLPSLSCYTIHCPILFHPMIWNLVLSHYTLLCYVVLYYILFCYVWCLMIAESLLLHYHLHYVLWFQCPVLPASTLHAMWCNSWYVMYCYGRICSNMLCGMFCYVQSWSVLFYSIIPLETIILFWYIIACVYSIQYIIRHRTLSYPFPPWHISARLCYTMVLFL